MWACLADIICMANANRVSPSTAAGDRLIRLPEVSARVGLARSSIYELIAVGKFPRQIRLTPRTSAWSASEIAEWIEERIRARDVGAQS
jgi:prophage regulatory protein